MRRFRSLRPVVAAAVLALALTLLVAPDGQVSDGALPRWFSGDTVIEAAQRQQLALRDSVLVLRSRWEELDSYSMSRGLTARGRGLDLRVDRGIPDTTAARFAEQVRAELGALSETPEQAIIVRIVVDSFSRVNYRRSTMLPERPDAPCVVLIRVASARLDGALPVATDQLLGVCGLYARFGAPGPGMDRWLERTEMRGAREHTGPDVARGARARIDATWLVELATPASCLAGREEACLRCFDGSWRSPLASLIATADAGEDPVRRLSVFARYGGGTAMWELSGLRASMGDERFARIWRSASEPAEAYEANEGSTLAAWVRATMGLETEPYRAGGMIAGLPLGLAFLLIVAFAGTAIGFTKRRYHG